MPKQNQASLYILCLVGYFVWNHNHGIYSKIVCLRALVAHLFRPPTCNCRCSRAPHCTTTSSILCPPKSQHALSLVVVKNYSPRKTLMWIIWSIYMIKKSEAILFLYTFFLYLLEKEQVYTPPRPQPPIARALRTLDV